MLQKSIFCTVAAIALNSSLCFAQNSWTEVDCGGLNETLQASRALASGTKKLTYAELFVLILGDKAAFGGPEGWPKNRPMPSNRYIDAQVKSVTPLQVPETSAAYLVVITSKNHVPETRVVCTFTDMHD
jgi:hypothetical protein